MANPTTFVCEALWGEGSSTLPADHQFSFLQTGKALKKIQLSAACITRSTDSPGMGDVPVTANIRRVVRNKTTPIPIAEYISAQQNKSSHFYQYFFNYLVHLENSVQHFLETSIWATTFRTSRANGPLFARPYTCDFPWKALFFMMSILSPWLLEKHEKLTDHHSQSSRNRVYYNAFLYMSLLYSEAF